ncbi:MAG TPA: hypothetical protein VF857_04975 [Spirochaetota bacterium]
MATKSKYSTSSFIRKVRAADLEITAQNAFVNIENILKSKISIEDAAERILETVLLDSSVITRKDALDRFLDYIYFKARTGHDHIINLAYPSKRIADDELEQRVIELINIHLIPSIIFPILKFFTRNVQNSDTNLYLAYLMQSEEVIRPVYETFMLFKKDIFKNDSEARSRNVQRLQQYVSSSDKKFSSPLDAACRLKYVLEYIALKQDVSKIYTAQDILLASPNAV